MLQRQIKKEIQSIKRQLVQKYKPEKIILFGSAAWGKFGADSDFDFFILKKNTPYLGVDRIREVDRLVDASFPCDFFIARPSEARKRLKLGDPFIRKIFSEGKILYGG